MGSWLRARVRVRFGAADLVFALGGRIEPVLGATLAALLARDALILRGVGVRVRGRGSARVRDRFRNSSPAWRWCTPLECRPQSSHSLSIPG